MYSHSHSHSPHSRRITAKFFFLLCRRLQYNLPHRARTIRHPQLTLTSHPSADMTTDNTSFLSTEQSCQHPAKQEPAKHWFTRHFSKSTSRKDPDSGDIVKMIKQNSVPRPRTSPSSDRPYTAPSSGPNTKDGSVRPLPRFPEQFQCLSVRQEINAPRSPQADPGIVLNVDAWLDASKPSSPLMGGLSYWREGNPADIKEATNMQYAIPIIREPECERPSTSHSQQLKSFCRRAKNQVRLPSIGRIKSSQAMDENTRSESSPVLAISYEQTQAGEAPVFSTRMGTPPTPRPSTCTGAGQMSRYVILYQTIRQTEYTDCCIQKPSSRGVS